MTTAPNTASTNTPSPRPSLAKRIGAELWSLTKSLILAAFLAFFVIRGLIVEPFRIPSSSMMPNLLIGDFLFVSKFAYGTRIPFTDFFLWQREPSRGDIVVFRRNDGTVPGSFWGLGDAMFIKRLVAVPGDTVAYQNKQLIVNGRALAKTADGTFTYRNRDQYGAWGNASGGQFVETAQNSNGETIQRNILNNDGAHSANLPKTTVPAGMYVVMGDNRDRSRDARCWADPVNFCWQGGSFGGQEPRWSFVPKRDISGRAEFIWLSIDENWKPRFNRFFDSLRPEKT